jgi:hypothetical protein
VLTISDGAGAGGLPHARLRARITEPTRQTQLRIANSEIEIIKRSNAAPIAGDPTAQAAETVLFWGKLSGAEVAIGGDESATYEARMSRHHFGEPVYGMEEFNPTINGNGILRQDLEFNPTISFSGTLGQRIQNTRGLGVVRGNMSDRRQWGKAKANTFLDPARVFSAAARRYNDGGSEATPKSIDDAKFTASDKHWTLLEAAYYLCWALNEAEPYIKNPTREDLKLLDDPTAIVRDVVIPLGTFLPEALDILLHPFGFGWRIDYAGRGSRKIAVFRRGSGVERTVRLQSPGESINPAKTNVETCRLGVGTESLINEVYVYGGRELYEATFNLKRAWSASLDDLDFFTLSTTHPDWKDNPQRHRVWRDWVLDEGGDYIGVRSDYKKPYDFEDIFGPGIGVVPRRRRFHPCLTLDKDRLPVGQNGYFVEFFDGLNWVSVEKLTNGSFEVLTNECGIRFTGVAPPEQLKFAGATAAIRITASVYSDERLLAVASRSGDSVQSDIIPLFIDAEGSFHKRKINSTSQFYDQVQSKAYESSQVDDQERIDEYAERIRSAWDQSDVSGTIVIPDLEEIYEIGTVIRRMEGRDIDFDIGSTAGKRYPQVVARTLDVQRQKQTLTLETMRNMRFT